MQTFRRFITILLAGLALAAGIIVGTASPANATAQTCLAAPGGTVCTTVYGSGTHVNSITVSRIKVNPFNGALTGICDYTAWFFAAPPGGGVQALGTQVARGCGFGRVWLSQPVNRNFPRGTQVCAKFYENLWNTFVSEKCVGVS